MKLTQRFNEALVFASELHAKQIRKGADIPYVSHLLAVASIVLEHGGGEDEAIAALLHDAIEDQAQHNGGAEALRRKIREKFGDIVAEIVDGCTDADTYPKPPWCERKERYLVHIRQAPHSVRLVSAADKLHNARAILSDYRTLADELWSRFNAGKGDQLWYYRELVKAFRDAGSSSLIDELDRVVTELEKLTNTEKEKSQKEPTMPQIKFTPLQTEIVQYWQHFSRQVPNWVGRNWPSEKTSQAIQEALRTGIPVKEWEENPDQPVMLPNGISRV
jgi:(p)ppGpp synthase/HD superfamily hydrolase